MAEKLWYSSTSTGLITFSLSFSLSIYPKLLVLFLKPEQLQFASIKTYSNKF